MSVFRSLLHVSTMAFLSMTGEFDMDSKPKNMNTMISHYTDEVIH